MASETGNSLLRDLLKKFENAREVHETHHTKWLEFYKYYKSSLTSKYNEYKTIRILPVAFSTIMSILPRIIMMKPKVRYIMRKYSRYMDEYFNNIENTLGVDIQAEKERVVELMDNIIKYQWRKFKGDVYLQKVLLYSLIYGTGILKVGWDVDNNMPIIRAIEPFYFYPNPDCEDPFEMDWCIVKYYVSPDKFKELFRKEKKGNDTNDISLMKDALDPFKASNTPKDLIEVYEYYDKKRIILFTKQEIIKSADNILGQIPIVVLYNYIPESGFWGMSEIDQIEQFIKDMTDFRANRHTNIELSSNLMWRIDPNREVFIEDLVSAPGQIIRAEQGALEPLTMPPLPQYTIQEDAILKNDVRETSGISDYLRGGTPQRFETATAIQNLVQSGNARIVLRVINLINFLIEPLGKLLVDFNKKFLKAENIVIKTDNGFKVVKISFDDIRMLDGEYDIITIPNNMDKTRKEEFIQFLQIMFSNPQFAQYVNVKELIKTMFKMWDIPTYNLLRSDDEIQQTQMQNQLMALLQQAQANQPQEQTQLNPNILMGGSNE